MVEKTRFLRVQSKTQGHSTVKKLSCFRVRSENQDPFGYGQKFRTPPGIFEKARKLPVRSKNQDPSDQGRLRIVPVWELSDRYNTDPSRYC